MNCSCTPSSQRATCQLCSHAVASDADTGTPHFFRLLYAKVPTLWNVRRMSPLLIGVDSAVAVTHWESVGSSDRTVEWTRRVLFAVTMKVPDGVKAPFAVRS